MYYFMFGNNANQHKNGKKYGTYTILVLFLLCCCQLEWKHVKWKRKRKRVNCEHEHQMNAIWYESKRTHHHYQYHTHKTHQISNGYTKKIQKFIWIIKWTNKLLTRYQNYDKKKKQQRSIYSCNVRTHTLSNSTHKYRIFCTVIYRFQYTCVWLISSSVFLWFSFYSFAVVSQSSCTHFKMMFWSAGCVVRSFVSKTIRFSSVYLSNVRPLTFFTNRQIKHTYAHLMLLMQYTTCIISKYTVATVTEK